MEHIFVESFDGNDSVLSELNVSLDEFATSCKDEDSILFQEKDESGRMLTIRIKLGSWDILDALVPKIIKYRPGEIVEVGMGESSTVFAKHAMKLGVKLTSCDIKMGGMFEVFDEPLYFNHICHIKKSEDFIKEYEGNPAIVFLDGEHRYEAIKREVDFFLPKILPGGVMFLHDTMPLYERSITPDEKGFSPGDVYKLRQELERNPDIDVFTWPYSAHDMGMTMVMKHWDRDKDYWRQNGRLHEAD